MKGTARAPSAAETASEALHARVRELARADVSKTSPGTLAPSSVVSSFDALALDIARFQAEHNPAVARLCRQRGIDAASITSLEQVPAVPADAFRLGRVAAHPPSSDRARFLTSGTTGGSGCHAFRTLDTYAELSVQWGQRALLGDSERCCTVLALAPPFEPERRSSLGYMMQLFMQHLDGRPLVTPALAPAPPIARMPRRESGAFEPFGPFDAREPGRWLLGGASVDVAGLRRGAELAEQRGEPVLLLATSFALVWLLDLLAGASLPLPERSVVLWTGGFKGRSRSVDAAELGQAVCRTFGVEPRQLIGEYGMTELASQLYDGGFDPGARQPSVFIEPPWLRVTPVDPISLAPVPRGEVGLARFTDLANVDSALHVLTQDRVRRVPGGIVLLGRQPSARLRGCSLAVEALVASASPPAVTASASSADSAPSTRRDRDHAASAASTRRAADASPRPDDPAPGGRIEQLLQAMRGAVEPGSGRREALVARLLETTGLARAGIEWALDHCLELQPSPAEQQRLIRGATPAPSAHVILPASVFVAPLRALALALAASPRVFVKPSRREPALIEALHAQAPHLFELVPRIQPRLGDHVFAYGSDTTLDALRRELPRGSVLHAHGSGFGAALIDLQTPRPRGEPESDRELARAIARDTACFDQRGCLSPRFVLALAEPARAQRFAARLAAELAELERRLPVGHLAAGERADAAWYRDCCACFGSIIPSGSGAVSVRDAVEPSWLAGESLAALEVPPSGRHLEVVALRRLEPALQTLRPWLTTVGCASPALEARARQLLDPIRVAPLGRMQTPPFDGPVDRRAPPEGERIE